MRILIVEDDAALVEVLERGFGEQGFEVHAARTAEEARKLLVFNAYGVVVLDVMLPGGTGTELCRRLRREGNAVPILMLTARDAIEDRVLGLGVGADDYLTKPFDFRELLARVQALSRRPPGMLPDVHEAGGLEVDLATRRVRRDGRTIELTAREYALLECFVRHSGRVLDRATLTSHVWDDNHDPFSNALEVLVKRLRAKVDEGFEPKLIHTLRGAGYRFGA
ncbi:MAG TPA: response regulator transcription factor [Longimicrobiales bacterium]|nr:response regulator transcription factor [Longimicrobiales bacterium]